MIDIEMYNGMAWHDGGMTLHIHASVRNGEGHLSGVAVRFYVNSIEVGTVASDNTGYSDLDVKLSPNQGRYVIEAVVDNPSTYFRKWCHTGRASRGGFGDVEDFIGPTMFENAEKVRKAEREQRAILEKAERAERARKAEIEKLLKSMKSLVRKASRSHNNISTGLAEMRIVAEQVEVDFKEGAFAPFWDGICSFAVKIGRLESEMRLIAQCHQTYKELYGRYPEIYRDGDPKPSPFRKEFLNPMDPKTLKRMTDWFRVTVRKGQTDFQFASIYEHYRTRDVLVEGFRDLVNKFNDISNALNSVNRSLISGFRELRECVEGLQESIGDEFEYLRECIKQEEENTRQVIKEEGQTTRRVAIASEAVSEIIRQKRHEELLSSFEYQQETTRQALEDEFEDLRDSIEEEGESDREFAEEIEDRRRERQRELLATYEHEQEEIRETLAVGLDRNETKEQERHEEVISEGKRDRKFLKDIDKQVGGEEWYKS